MAATVIVIILVVYWRRQKRSTAKMSDVNEAAFSAASVVMHSNPFYSPGLTTKEPDPDQRYDTLSKINCYHPVTFNLNHMSPGNDFYSNPPSKSATLVSYDAVSYSVPNALDEGVSTSNAGLVGSSFRAGDYVVPLEGSVLVNSGDGDLYALPYERPPSNHYLDVKPTSDA